MTREQPKCETCRHYDAVSDADGLCRVNSPVMSQDRRTGVWPMVSDRDWCSHHRPFFKVVKTPLGVMMAPMEKGDE